MKNQPSAIPAHVLDRAKQVGIDQGYLPLSPYALDGDSNISLCAAACLAYAGCEANSPTAARDFLRTLIADRSDTTLAAVFEQLSWPESLCHFVRIENDSTPAELRLATFVMRCEALKKKKL